VRLLRLLRGVRLLLDSFSSLVSRPAILAGYQHQIPTRTEIWKLRHGALDLRWMDVLRKLVFSSSFVV
jgi:hypothetical protein